MKEKKVKVKKTKSVLFSFVLFFLLVFLPGSNASESINSGNNNQVQDLDSQISYSSSRTGIYKVSGLVRTNCWVPIPNITVCAVPAARYVSEKCKKNSSQTDSNGYYEISGLKGNTKYTIKVNIDDRDKPYFFMPMRELKTDYAPTMASVIQITNSDVTDVNFEKIEIPDAGWVFIKPMSDSDLDLENYGYTYAEYAYYKGIGWVYHPGQDYNSFKDASNTVPIYAVADGVVVDVRPDEGLKWGGIVIKHWIQESWYWWNAYYSQYGHISVDINPQENGIQKLQIGQIVYQGDLIGYEDKIGIGNTDYHLHFEIRNSNHPYPYDRDYFGGSPSTQLKKNNIYSWYEHPDSFIESVKYPNSIIVIDEMEDEFSSGGNLINFDNYPNDTVGFGGHMKYTFTTAETEPTAWGKWSFDITQGGYYEIEVFIPKRRGTSTQAQYKLNGNRIVPTINQLINEDKWVRVGSGYHYLHIGRNYLKLENNTCETGEYLAFDAIRVTYQNYQCKPAIEWFRINHGTESTEDRAVELNNSCICNPTHYMASEYPNFKDAEWDVYSEAPVFYLKGGFGKKKIFLKVKNQYGESDVLKDTIKWEQNSLPFVASFKINDGAASTNSRIVTLNNGATRNPTHYMASEDSNFQGAAWKPYSNAPSFTLSDGNGIKTVFFKVKNKDGVSGKASDTIELKQGSTPSVTSFKINNGAQCTTGSVVTLNNTVTGGPTHIIASENPNFTGAVWQNYSGAPSFSLSSGNGNKQVFLKVKNDKGESDAVSDAILKIPKYTATPTITTNGGGTWDNVLKLHASINCATLTLKVTKIYDTPWETSGTLYFRMDDWDEDGVLIADPVNPVFINAGTLSFSYHVNLTRYSGTYPRKFYVLFVSADVIGYAWAGFITVTEE